MKRWLIAGMLAVSSVLLGGCATSAIKSDVTAFHEWPQNLPGKSYVFERTKEQDESLEYRNYENLVRAELSRLGFVEAPVSTKPFLKTSIAYSISSRDVREVYPVIVDRYWSTPWPAYYGPFHRPFHDPFFYDPFWYGPPAVEQRVAQYVMYTRRLQLAIAQMADGKKLYETTVVSEGTNGSLPAVMPYMVRSAFADFPGKSGVPHRVELPLEK